MTAFEAVVVSYLALCKLLCVGLPQKQAQLCLLRTDNCQPAPCTPCSWLFGLIAINPK